MFNRQSILIAVILAIPGMLGATPGQDKFDRLMAQAQTLIAAHKLQEAHKTLEGALKLDPKSRAALAAIGKVEIAMENWGEANNRFKDIHRLDANDLEAHYYRGICYRESGKFKALLLRKFDWDKAAQHFQAVLAADSLYRDTLYQYAVLQRFRDKYTQAIRLGHDMIRLNPALLEPQVKLFRLYRYFLDHKGDEEAVAWLRQQPWDQARFAIGENCRLAGKFPEAQEIFNELLQEPLQMSRQPVRLAYAKLEYTLGHYASAQQYYFDSVDEIASALDAAFIFEDVKFVLKEEELLEYRRLESPTEFQAFFRRIWARRDPTPAAAINIRLAEHFRRLVYTEKNFVYDGFRTWFNNPDKLGYFDFNDVYALNDQFNDKGVVFVRHGPPDDRVVSLGQFTSSNESWLYYKAPDREEMTFHFVVDANASGNNWRLIPIITDRNMLQDRVQWGPIYYRMLNANQLEQLSLEQEMADNSTRSVEHGLDSDRHTWSEKLEPLEFESYSAAFRAPDGDTYLELYYGIAAKQLLDKTSETAETIRLERGLALHDAEWRTQHKGAQNVVLNTAALRQMPHETYIDGYRFQAKPGEYHLAFHARQLDSDPNRLGGFNLDVVLPAFSTSRLQISGITLAYDMIADGGDSPMHKQGIRIIPNPSKKFDRQQPVHLYYEVYNLQAVGGASAQFLVEYKIDLVKGKKKGLFGGLFGGGGKTSISLAAERESPTPTSYEQIALDLSKAKPGEYDLTITVTESSTNSTDSATIRLELN